MVGTDDNGMLTVFDDGAQAIAGRAPYDYEAHCPMPARVRLDLGDGDDWASFDSNYPQNLPIEIDGGPGKDQLQTYGGGNFVTLDGGDGADLLKGWDSQRHAARRPRRRRDPGLRRRRPHRGRRRQRPARARHLPRSRARLRRRRRRDRQDRRLHIPCNDYNPPITLSMDGVANDGRPGENDNVVNVEKVESHVSGTFAGGAGDDDFAVLANIDEGNSSISGGAGNDKLVAGDYADTLDGGPGNDYINGGFGNDTITGGPGQDTILGDATAASCGWYSYTCKIPFGNDVIYARDGEQDTIDCGVGEDRAVVDTIDIVSNCETVDAAGAPRAAAPRGAAAPAVPGGTAGGGPQLTVKAVGKKQLRVTVPVRRRLQGLRDAERVTARSSRPAKTTLLQGGQREADAEVQASRRKNTKATLKVTISGRDRQGERVEDGHAEALARLRGPRARRRSAGSSRSAGCSRASARGAAAAERAQAALAVLVHEVGERAEPAHPGAVRRQIDLVPVCGKRVREGVDALARGQGRHAQHGRVGGAERPERRAEVVLRAPARDRAEVGLGDDEHVRDLHDPGLQELQRVAAARAGRRPPRCPPPPPRRSRTGPRRPSRSPRRRTRWPAPAPPPAWPARARPSRSPAAIERMNTSRSAGSCSIRARSPSSAPPERLDDGSTASTATARPRARHARTSARAASTCRRRAGR